MGLSIMAGACGSREHGREVGRPHVERTLVVLVEISGILREIVREVVAGEPDLSILEGDEAPRVIQTGGACVAITHLDDPAPASLARLLGARPEIRVIALSSDGRNGMVYELQLRRRPLGTADVSAAELLAAIRRPLADPQPDDD
jgi:hypothetical protein